MLSFRRESLGAQCVAWWTGFCRGAQAPSPWALLGAVGVALAWIGFACVGIQESFLLSHDGRGMMRGSHDESAWVSAQALRAGSSTCVAEAAKVPRICLVGASNLRESVLEPSALGELAREMWGGPVEVVDLVMSSMLWEERAALLDRVGVHFEGVVVLEVGPQQMSRNTEMLRRFARAPRLGFQSDIFDEECRSAGIPRPRSTGIYSLDNAAFLARRMGL